MARLPRLALPGQAHYVIQRAQPRAGGGDVFSDAGDRGAFVAALRTAVDTHPVQIHAWGLQPDEWQLLATPLEAGALSALVQDVGRRYVSAYNRRHALKGSPWDGRYRCGVVEPGPWRLAALGLVDGGSSGERGGGAPAAGVAGGDGAASAGWSSAGHRTGLAPDPVVTDPPEWWPLGNTPFEREAAYRQLLADGVEPETARALRRAALGGWAAGSAAFVAWVEATAARPARPRAAGRPPRKPYGA